MAGPCTFPSGLDLYLRRHLSCTFSSSAFTIFTHLLHLLSIMASLLRGVPRALPVSPANVALLPSVSAASSAASRFGRTASSSFDGGRRCLSVYGYLQAKALVYSKYGEPKDVLQYGELLPMCPFI